MTISPVPVPTLDVEEEFPALESGVGAPVPTGPAGTDGPGEYPARSADGQVHVVSGADAALGRTLCGRTVLVVYDHEIGTTCPACDENTRHGQVPMVYEPCG